MMMDIEAAFDTSQGSPQSRICKIGRWLEAIPEDTPGLERLRATLGENDTTSADWRSLEDIDAILARLGLLTSIKTISNHRSRRCRCFR